jgi:hypothetical protein
MMSKGVVRLRIAALWGVLALVPTTGAAQQASGIAGTVKDSSGAVLPGVTVEAASPALIEKVRSAITDGEGRYNIVDLRPGTYVVTFSLAGFNTFRREGIVLTSGFTAAVNGDMQVGALEETITVTGAAPLVDTQNVRQQESVSDELLSALPSGSKGFMGIARLIPGMSGNSDSGGGSGIYSSNSAHAATIHGKGNGKMSYDGMQTSNQSLNGHTSYVMNPATVEETVVLTGGISAESDASGLLINLVPKEGGNLFKFGADGVFTNERFQSDNLTDRVRARGVTTTHTVQHLYDANLYAGGPVKRDRLWFFAATRFTGSQNQVGGIFFNKTQGTPFYTPDLDRPAFRREWLKGQSVRLTWQVSPRNKINTFSDTQSYQVRGRGGNEAPEAQTVWSFWPNGLYQVTWNSPVTSKFLLEAGASYAQNGYPYTREQVTDIFGFIVKPTDISILEASTGFRYNAKSSYADVNDQDRYVQRFSASYVTGSHNFKAGFQLQQGVLNQDNIVNEDITYIFARGVPTTVVQWATPYQNRVRTRAELGVFVQDQWVLRRLTLNLGLRFDYFNGYVPEQHVPAVRFVGARDYPEVKGVPDWRDLNPRLGGSYDLFGTGRTALKASIGRYVGKMGPSVATANNPLLTSINSVTRTWGDADGNYVPNCDLHNFDANGECGPISNRNFGRINPSAQQYTDDLIRGFGTRDYLWDFSAEVQHQLTPRVSLKGGWYRNWTSQFGVIFSGSNSGGWPTGVADNLAVTPADFDTYCITAPVDPRLPGGGGYPVCGLYDIAPSKFGIGNEIVTRASNYDDGKSRISNFFTGSVTTRLGTGIELGGSLDTGRIVEDNCFVVDSPQALLNCRVVAPYRSQTQIKTHWSLPLPGAFLVSGVLQNLSGVPYEANYAVSNAQIAPSLGRNLAACGTRPVCTATATVPLIAPLTQFEPRRTLIDLRLSKIFSLGARTRLRANLDVYNVLNDGSVVSTNNNYGASWLQPIGGAFTAGLADGRLIQFGAQLTF